MSSQNIRAGSARPETRLVERLLARLGEVHRTTRRQSSRRTVAVFGRGLLGNGPQPLQVRTPEEGSRGIVIVSTRPPNFPASATPAGDCTDATARACRAAGRGGFAASPPGGKTNRLVVSGSVS